MLEILKRDWILFRQKFLYLIPIMSISLILLYPKSDEGYFIIGLPVVFIISILLFVHDDKDKGILQLISMPFSRMEIARGRFFSTWVFIASGMVYIIGLGLLLGLFYPTAIQSFLGLLTMKMLFTYLWFLSTMALLIFPLMYFFLGKGLQALILAGLGLNVLFGVFFLIQSQSSGRDIYSMLESVVHVLYNYHSGVGNILLSILGLLLMNFVNLKVCEWIFIRKEF